MWAPLERCATPRDTGGAPPLSRASTYGWPYWVLLAYHIGCHVACYTVYCLRGALRVMFAPHPVTRNKQTQVDVRRRWLGRGGPWEAEVVRRWRSLEGGGPREAGILGRGGGPWEAEVLGRRGSSGGGEVLGRRPSPASRRTSSVIHPRVCRASEQASVISISICMYVCIYVYRKKYARTWTCRRRSSARRRFC